MKRGRIRGGKVEMRVFLFSSSCYRPLAVCKRRTGLLMTELLSSQVAHCGQGA